MTEEEKLAYLAGIIDGEGSIMITRSNENYGLKIAVANTKKELLDWLKNEFGGAVFPMKDSRVEERGWKQSYAWNLHGKRAYKLLGKLHDNLIIKREQQKIAVEFYSQCCRAHYGNHRKMPKWLKDREEEYCQRIRALNKKGRGNEEEEEETLNEKPQLHEQQQLQHPY